MLCIYNFMFHDFDTVNTFNIWIESLLLTRNRQFEILHFIMLFLLKSPATFEYLSSCFPKQTTSSNVLVTGNPKRNRNACCMFKQLFKHSPSFCVFFTKDYIRKKRYVRKQKNARNSFQCSQAHMLFYSFFPSLLPNGILNTYL